MNKASSKCIMIKPLYKGKFIEYCKNKRFTGVTQKCVDDVKDSKSKALIKQAIFAENSRKWRD